MMLEVTQEDIDTGVPDNGQACAIACALKRQLHVDHIEVDFDSVFLNRQYYVLPYEVTQFIRQFDAGKTVQPQIFYLPIPEQETSDE